MIYHISIIIYYQLALDRISSHQILERLLAQNLFKWIKKTNPSKYSPAHRVKLGITLILLDLLSTDN